MPHINTSLPKPNAIEATLKFDGHTVPHKQFFFQKISPRPVRRANSSCGGFVPRSDVNLDPSIGLMRPTKPPKKCYNNNKTTDDKHLKKTRFDGSNSDTSTSSSRSVVVAVVVVLNVMTDVEKKKNPPQREATHRSY
jgi:hypothetical protein